VAVPVVALAGAGPDTGAKAANLRWLIARGHRVPAGFVVPAGCDLPDLDPWLAAGTSYAVRSSASVEDSTDHSFAGQFHTVLGVRGAPAVREAIEQVRASARDPRVLPYFDAAGISPDDVRMNVIVQEMVPALTSGVAFSRNPMTGLNEVVIEAVPGSGEALVSGRATPTRWVRRWGAWTTQPGDPLPPEPVARSLAELVGDLGDEWGAPVDVEWAWDGSALSLLQMRPMTAVDVPVYSNRISREFLPGIVLPLVWSVNVPVVNRAWLELFASLVGPLDLRPEDLARQFAYRAYFNMGAVGDVLAAMGMSRDLLEVMLGLEGGTDRPVFRPDRTVVRHVPRMARMTGRLLRYDRELDRILPGLEQRTTEIEARPLAARTDDQLVDQMAELEQLVERLAFCNIVAPLLMNGYGALLSRRLRRRGIDPHTVDPAAGDPQLERYDPKPHLARLAEALAHLDEPTRSAAVRGDLGAIPGGAEFVARFGHLSDSGNDFSTVPWREDPTRLVPLLTSAAPTGGSALPRGAAAPSLSGPDRAIARRAGRFRVERERVSYAFTRGYGLFRPTVLEMGARLVARGALDSVDDVFLLTRRELEQALIAPAPTGLADLVGRRRAEIAEVRDLAMPAVIYGDDFTPAPAADPDHSLVGIPASRGIHRATARVVAGIEAAGRVQDGDVLVIPYSDVGWTPMLARAGAIVAESGGLLSHSSILARELGIPCVVSVHGAMGIPDGALVRVDGYTGGVIWEAEG
jgi:pyruvate,water dikinase